MNHFYFIYIVIAFIIIYVFYQSSKKRKSDTTRTKKYMSKSEYLIADYLERNSISFKEQYKFKNCKDKKELPFDFAIIDKKGKPIFLIEYDGEQHYHPVQFKRQSRRQARKNYKLCKKHDRIKNRYCKKRNIYLLRISYKERRDMFKIIDKELHNFNLKK